MQINVAIMSASIDPLKEKYEIKRMAFTNRVGQILGTNDSLQRHPGVQAPSIIWPFCKNRQKAFFCTEASRLGYAGPEAMQ